MYSGYHIIIKTEPNTTYVWLNYWLALYLCQCPRCRDNGTCFAQYSNFACVVVFFQSLSHVCDFTDCSTPGFPVLHYLLEFVQTHWTLSQWCHRTISSSVAPSSPALNLSQHQGLFQYVGCSHQMAKVLELHHQSFQWIFKVDFL